MTAERLAELKKMAGGGSDYVVLLYAIEELVKEVESLKSNKPPAVNKGITPGFLVQTLVGAALIFLVYAVIGKR